MDAKIEKQIVIPIELQVLIWRQIFSNEIVPNIHSQANKINSKIKLYNDESLHILPWCFDIDIENHVFGAWNITRALQGFSNMAYFIQ